VDVLAVEHLDPRTISDRDAEAISQLRKRVWVNASADGFIADPYKSSWQEYSGPEAQAPVIFVIRHGRETIAMAKTLPRVVQPRGQSAMQVMGLASVCTSPDWRGKGLGKAVVRAALARVDRSEFTWAVFQCPPSRQTFYERLGVRRVHNRFHRTDEKGAGANPFWDECAMCYPDREDWPDVDIAVPSPGW
jgi:predicted N-acetyltransferase YhbS